MNQENKIPQDSAASRKRPVIIVLGIVFLLMILLIALNTIDFDALAEKLKGDDDSHATPVVTYSPYYFTEPDYNEDVSKDGEYMKLDRNIYYEFGGEVVTFGLKNDDKDRLHKFWQTYFTALIEGDSGALDALATDKYIEKNGRSAKFAPQKVHNMRVELLEMRELVDGDANGEYVGYTVYYFKVAYQIKDNNGTFRNDYFDEGYSVPLVFEILEGRDVKLSSVSRINASTGENEGKIRISVMVFVWFGLICSAVVAELMTLSLVAVCFVPAGIASLLVAIFLPEQLALQILLYVITVAVLLLLTRPIAKKLRQKGKLGRKASRQVDAALEDKPDTEDDSEKDDRDSSGVEN